MRFQKLSQNTQKRTRPACITQTLVAQKYNSARDSSAGKRLAAAKEDLTGFLTPTGQASHKHLQLEFWRSNSVSWTLWVPGIHVVHIHKRNSHLFIHIKEYKKLQGAEYEYGGALL